MADDPLIDSLKQLSPQVPSDVKSRLLYECGVAATELKYRRQRKRHFQIATMAVLLATFAGGFIGNQFNSPIQQTTVAERQTTTTEQQSSPAKSPLASRDKSILTAAMPIDQLMKLLAHKDNSSSAENIEAKPLTIEPPFTTRSLAEALERL